MAHTSSSASLAPLPPFRLGSLFAGIGGFDLAARWMGWDTAWFSEIDPYASAVLAQHWPGVPNHGDICAMRGAELEPVDMLVGGFPCQDLSVANPKGHGLDGARSGLWREYARLIRECRPEWVVIENVPGLLRRGYDVVRGDLRAAGYRVARPVVMSASQVGAPYVRRRLWIVAHRDVLADADRARREERRRSEPIPPQHAAAQYRGEDRVGTGDWWAAEPHVGRVATSVPSRVDRLRCLGNAVVPPCALAIFEGIEHARAAQEGRRMSAATRRAG